MVSKLYLVAIICLAGGLIGGYLVTSTSFQNQNNAYQARLQSQDAEITAKDAIIQVKDAQLQAKDAQIQALNTQIQAQVTQIQAQITLIQTQQTLLEQLKGNVTLLQEQIQLIGDQLSTHIRIDSIIWGNGSFSVDVRNTGGNNAAIASISIRVNQTGSTPTTFETPYVRASIPIGTHALITSNYSWLQSTSYVIRVTTNSGLFYETLSTSPVG